MFHYSLVSGGREFQPVCLAIKGTIGQIISGLCSGMKHHLPISKDTVPVKSWLGPSVGGNKPQIPQIPWGKGSWAAKQAPDGFAIEGKHHEHLQCTV